MEEAPDRELLEAAAAQVEPEDEIMFAFTSGTTGQPKAAAITHKSQIAAARGQTKHIRVTSKDILMLTSPFSHVGGITIGMALHACGGRSDDSPSGFSAGGGVETRLRNTIPP